MSTQAIAQPKPRRLSPFAALLWEEWRQTRQPLLLGFAATLVAVINILNIGYWVPVPTRESLEFGWVYGFMVLLFSWQGGILLFSGYGRNDLSLQFPRRLFALPVHTTALALTRMAYGVAVVAATFGLLGWATATVRPDLFAPGYVHAFVAVQVLLYLQGIAWFFGRRPALALGMSLVLWFPFAVVSREIIILTSPSSYLSLLMTTLLASSPVIVVFTALALYAVSVQRKGGTVGRHTALDRLKRMRTAIAGEPATPERTLFDFEWRRRGRWVPVFGLMSAFLLMLLFSGITMTPFAGYFALLLGCLSGLFAAGLFQVIVSERERVSGLQRFLMTKPASTRKLGQARLWALGAGYSITFVVLCLLMVGALQVMQLQGGMRTMVLRSFFSPIQFVEDRMDEIHKPPVPAQEPGDRRAPAAISPGREALTPAARDVEVLVKYESVSWGLAKVLTSLAFFFLLGWLCLTQPLTTLFVFYVVAVLANSLDGKAGWESDWGYTGFSAIVSAGVIGLTVMHLRRAFRRGLLSRRALYAVLVAWFVLAYSAVYLCVRAGGTPREVLGLQSSLVAFALVLATFALPFWPFATIPLSIHRHRHQ